MCCADFNYYINRQGIQGRKGEKGDKGFSPTINVSTDTVDEYKLIIANEDNTFETPNLRGNINVLDNGGTYLRYDKETQQISAQDMDAATADTLGGVRLSTEENITAMSADTVVTPADVADALPVYLEPVGDVTIMQDEETSKTKIGVDLSGVRTDISNITADLNTAKAEIVDVQNSVNGKQDKLTAGEGITINESNVISVNTEATKATGTTPINVDEANNITLDIDEQTLNIIDGKLHVNMDELGNEVNDLSGRVTATEADIATLQTNVADLTGAVENKQNKLVSGDNIILTDNEDGTTTISSTGGSGSIYKAGKGILIDAENNISIATKNTKNNFIVQGEIEVINDSIRNNGQEACVYVDLTIDFRRPFEFVYHYEYNGVRGSYQDSWIVGMYSTSASSDPYHHDTYTSPSRIWIGSSGYNNLAGSGYIKFVNNGNGKYNLFYSSDYVTWTQIANNASFPITGRIDNIRIYFTGAGSVSSNRWTKSTIYGDHTYIKYTDTDETVWTLFNADGAVPATATTTSLGLVKPDGTTITVDQYGAISANVPTLTNMVTTDTAQTITGVKTFGSQKLIIGEDKNSQISFIAGKTGATVLNNITTNRINPTNTSNGVIIEGAARNAGVNGGGYSGDVVNSADPQYYLADNDIIAGNGITVDKTTNVSGRYSKITISSTGATINDTTVSTTTTYSSSKINELIGSISTALNNINGEEV